MTTRKPWTPAENLTVSRLYFDMLEHADAGLQYNKAGMIRERQTGSYIKMPCPGIGPLANRSRPSIEAKLMNCSAAHRDLLRAAGFEADGTDATAATMDGHGYRCLPNYQQSLRDAMAAEMHRRQQAAFHAERSA